MVAASTAPPMRSTSVPSAMPPPSDCGMIRVTIATEQSIVRMPAISPAEIPVMAVKGSNLLSTKCFNLIRGRPAQLVDTTTRALCAQIPQHRATRSAVRAAQPDRKADELIAPRRDLGKIDSFEQD